MKNIFKSQLFAIIIGAWLNILIFDLLWSIGTTFRGFSNPLTYINGMLLACVISLPYVITRKVCASGALALAIDALLICNLMYCRTYMSAIPLSSYAYAGNLADFKASVFDSMRILDFTLIIFTILWWLYAMRRPKFDCIRQWKAWAATTAIIAFLSFIVTLCQDGFTKKYSEMANSCYSSTCTTAAYTVFGNIIYDWTNESESTTAEEQALIDNWFDAKNQLEPYTPLPKDSLQQRTSIVLILLESFESWLINSYVEGQEITPNLNALVADSATLYVPHVLTQVGPGRSIDAQLLINAGLLPMLSNVYSMKYPQADYPTLIKAMKENSDGNFKSYLFSPDKPYVWNQATIAKSFGFDTLLMEDAWKPSKHRIGTGKGKIPDAELCLQIVEKMSSGEIWSVGEEAFIQIVTFSGHNPFKLPDELKKIRFSNNVPERMADYMTMANYTDGAIAQIISYLKSRPDYDNTLIVITGDHEGLAANREELLKSTIGREYIDEEQFTPFIVINSPKPLRYDDTIGQIDLYPTILNLMHLDNYHWKGLGNSIFSATPPSAAINSMSGKLVGDTAPLCGSEQRDSTTSNPNSSNAITPAEKQSDKSNTISSRFDLLHTARKISDLLIPTLH